MCKRGECRRGAYRQPRAWGIDLREVEQPRRPSARHDPHPQCLFRADGSALITIPDEARGALARLHAGMPRGAIHYQRAARSWLVDAPWAEVAAALVLSCWPDARVAGGGR